MAQVGVRPIDIRFGRAQPGDSTIAECISPAFRLYNRYQWPEAAPRTMPHPICRVVSFEIVSAHLLRIRFDDRTEQTIDFRPILAGELYGPLRDLELFNRVAIDGEAHTLVWPNGADF